MLPENLEIVSTMATSTAIYYNTYLIRCYIIHLHIKSVINYSQAHKS